LKNSVKRRAGVTRPFQQPVNKYTQFRTIGGRWPLRKPEGAFSIRTCNVFLKSCIFSGVLAMKEKDAQVKCDDHQMVLFVEKKDGTYGAVQTGSYMVHNYVDDFWDKRRKLEQDLGRRLDTGEISPVAYYLTLREMAVADLAARVGLSRGRVKKHMQPKHFREISAETATRYADVFGISVAQLHQVSPLVVETDPAGSSSAARVPNPRSKQ
jgi:hypothetical protein